LRGSVVVSGNIIYQPTTQSNVNQATSSYVSNILRNTQTSAVNVQAVQQVTQQSSCTTVNGAQMDLVVQHVK
jgi:hypothetical protein